MIRDPFGFTPAITRRRRRASAVALGVVTLFAGRPASAGDLIAHHFISEQACDAEKKVTPMLDDGTTLPDSNTCGEWAEMPDLWNIEAVAVVANNSDLFARFGPAKLRAQIAAKLEGITAKAAALFPQTNAVANWYHFAANKFDLYQAIDVANLAFDPNNPANSEAGKLLLATPFTDDTKTLHNCNVRDTTSNNKASYEFWKRVIVSTHLDPEDGQCAQHQGGNAFCDPGSDRGFFFPGTDSCATYIRDTLLPNIRDASHNCDDEVRKWVTKTRRVLKRVGTWKVKLTTYSYLAADYSTQVTAIKDARFLAKGARAGLERIYGHHCQKYNPNLACSGSGLAAAGQTLTADPDYCECEIYDTTAKNDNGLTSMAGDKTYVYTDATVGTTKLVTAAQARIHAGVTFYNKTCGKPKAKACLQPSDCDAYCNIPNSYGPDFVTTDVCNATPIF